MYAFEHNIQGGVTPIYSIVTAANIVSQQSMVKLPEQVQSTVKATQKYGQRSGPSTEWTQILPGCNPIRTGTDCSNVMRVGLHMRVEQQSVKCYLRSWSESDAKNGFGEGSIGFSVSTG